VRGSRFAGATFDDVCKSSVWLHDARDFGALNRIYASYFKNGKPARSTTEARLMLDAKVEIDMIAYRPTC
jgi:enamine deaminase RidA (YjgF/YER057c/UK114 family)